MVRESKSIVRQPPLQENEGGGVRRKCKKKAERLNNEWEVELELWVLK